MELLGYSERGVVNALSHEIHYAQRSEALLHGLLSLAQFPFCADAMPPSVSAAQVLLEQSFADFGDADVVMLLTAGERRLAMFLEAKVQTAQGPRWSIDQEFARFQGGVSSGNVSCSNLFSQLYLKARLVTGLQTCPDVSHCEVEMPPCFWKRKGTTKPSTKRRIGKSTVVREAADRVRAHLGEARYIALLPGSLADIQAFLTTTLAQAGDLSLTGWDVTHWGFLAWEDVRKFCERNALYNTLAVFNFNAGAII